MENKNLHSKELFSREVGEKEKRKLEALHENKKSIWSGLGLFGMVGWSVAVPTLLGAALGLWLDKKHPQHFSWALTCLLAGMMAGCIIAWNWVNKENKSMYKKKEEKDD